MTWRIWRCWEATRRRWGTQAAKHTRAGRRGLFLPELAPRHGFVLGWLYTPRRRPSDAVDRGLWPIAAFGRRRPWIAAFSRRRRSRDRESMQCRSMNLGIVRICKAAGSAHAPPVPSVSTLQSTYCIDDATHTDLGPKQLSTMMCYRLFLVQWNQCATHHYTSWFCVIKLAF